MPQAATLESLALRRALGVRRSRLLRSAFTALRCAALHGRQSLLLQRAAALWRRRELAAALRTWRELAQAQAVRTRALRSLVARRAAHWLLVRTLATWRRRLAHVAWRARCACAIVALRRRNLLARAWAFWASARRRARRERKALHYVAAKRQRAVLTAWRVLAAGELARRWAEARDGANAAAALATARARDAHERAAAATQHAAEADGLRADAAAALARAELRCAAAPGGALLDVPLAWHALRPSGAPPPPSLRPAAAAALLPGSVRGSLVEDVAFCDAGSARGGPGAPSFALAVLRRDAAPAAPADGIAGGDGRWVVPAVQGAPPRAREHPAACAVGVNGSLLFFGGFDGAAELGDAFLLRRLAPSAGGRFAPRPRAGEPPREDAPRFAWSGPLPPTAGAPLPRSHASLTASPDGATAYLFGGYRGEQRALNELWAVRPAARLDGTRSSKAASAAASNGLDPWEDPVALSWFMPRADGVTPAPRSGHAACVDADGCLYIFGGFDGETELGDLHRYDPAEQAWEQLLPWGPAPAPRRLHAMATAGRHLVVFGGWDGCVHGLLDFVNLCACCADNKCLCLLQDA